MAYYTNSQRLSQRFVSAGWPSKLTCWARYPPKLPPATTTCWWPEKCSRNASISSTSFANEYGGVHELFPWPRKSNPKIRYLSTSGLYALKSAEWVPTCSPHSARTSASRAIRVIRYICRGRTETASTVKQDDKTTIWRAINTVLKISAIEGYTRHVVLWSRVVVMRSKREKVDLYLCFIQTPACGP